MNRKQLITLLVIGLLIGGMGVVFYFQKSASWQATDQAMGQTILKDFPLNDVTSIRIKQSDGELSLAKVDDRWAVKERWNYPANFSEISDLLRKMWELKAVQALKIGPSQYGRLELLSPEKDPGGNAGTLVEFNDKSGKPVHSLLLGKKATRNSENASPFGGGDYPVGRYVALPDQPETAWLISETFSEVEPKPDRWLSKDFFKVEKLRSLAVTHPNATSSWTLVREQEGGDLDLLDKQPGEEFDKNKAYGAGNALSYPSFTDVLNPTANAGEGAMEAPIVARLETFDHFVYVIRTAKAPGTNDDNYQLQMTVSADLVKERPPVQEESPEDKERLDKEFQEKLAKLQEKLKQEKAHENWTYAVSKWTVDPLLKERKDFLAEPKAPDSADAHEGHDHSAHDGHDHAAPDLKDAVEAGLLPPSPPFLPGNKIKDLE